MSWGYIGRGVDFSKWNGAHPHLKEDSATQKIVAIKNYWPYLVMARREGVWRAGGKGENVYKAELRKKHSCKSELKGKEATLES